MRYRVVGGAISGAALLLLGMGEPLEAQVTDACYLGLQAGVRIPIEKPPFASRGDLELDVGGGTAVRLICRPVGELQLGASVEGNYLDPLFLGHLLGTVGTRWALGEGPRPPWLRVSGGIGLTGTAQLGTLPMTLPTGVAMKLDGVGVGFGSDIDLGFPMSDGTSLLISVALRWSLLQTERLPEGDDVGLASLGYLPISIGYEFKL